MRRSLVWRAARSAWREISRQASRCHKYPQASSEWARLRCFGLREHERLEGVLEHILDSACEVERHFVAHALGDVIDVLLVALGEDDLLQPHPVSGQHLLLDATHRKHQTL